MQEDFKTQKTLVDKIYDGKEPIQLSITDRNRIDELTDFYRHLNVIVENIIEKYSFQEKALDKIVKQTNANSMHLQQTLNLSPV